MLSSFYHGSPSFLEGATTRSLKVVTQVRNASKGRIAYPTYPFKRLAREPPKKHDSNLKYAMRQFLGPKNFKNEYPLNKYSVIPTNHVPNYITPMKDRGQALINPNTGAGLRETFNGKYEEVDATSGRRDRDGGMNYVNLHPFPLNPYCRTNYMVPDDLKLKIFNDIENEGLSAQQVSQTYGLKISRVEAIVKLMKIEQRWEQKNMISDNLRRMSSTMYNMFPLFKQDSVASRENLSEIPMPPKTLQSRFATIAESEPFGPVDAANILELEPAVKTLERLSTAGEHSANSAKTGSETSETTPKTRIVLGELREGDRSRLKFRDIRASKVAYRYGAGNRDNKKDRKIGFDERGRMVYI